MTDLLNSIAEHWFNWQFSMLWQTAVLIGIIWILDILIRKWTWPQVRYALWMLVLVKLLMPPTWTSPASVTSHIPAAAIRASTVMERADRNTTARSANTGMDSGRTAAVLERTDGNTAARNTSAGMNVPEGQDTIAGDEIPGMGSIQKSPSGAVQIGLVFSWQVYAMLTWLAGIAVLSTWLIIRLSALRREHISRWYGQAKLDRGLPERFYQQLESVAAKLNLLRIPRVILTDKVAAPAVFGVFRPVLLMPAEKFKTMSAQDTEHILLHELAHIKRGDLLVHAVYMLLQIVYWFNPLLWMIRRTLQNLRELCCDATVARLLREDTVHYRQTLLETARRLLAEPIDPGLGLLGLFENSNWLVTRLQWLEKNTWKNRPIRIATIILLVTIMTACVLPMANRPSTDSDFFMDTTQGYIRGDIKIDDLSRALIDMAHMHQWHQAYAKSVGSGGDGTGPEYLTIDYTIPQNKKLSIEAIAEHRQSTIIRMKLEGGAEPALADIMTELARRLELLPKSKSKSLFNPGEPEFVIKGTVTDAQTGEAIAGAKVGDTKRYNEGQFFTVTDPNGHYEYKTWYEEHGVVAEADGYESEGSGFSTKLFGKEKEKVINFELEKLSASQTENIKDWVEDFFRHNYRDITARKTIEWGRPAAHDDGTISIRYKYEATIWDKDKIIENKVWTFDKDGKFLHVRKVGAEDIYSLAGAQALVEDFFANNYQDITKRKTIEWGQPVKHENGNVSIRHKYEATIWDKDKVIENKVWTFDKDGTFVLVEKIIPNFELTPENFKAPLHNGVTVELVGVCEYPSKGKQWWSPDGQTFIEAPYDALLSEVSFLYEGRTWVMAAQLSGPASETSQNAQVSWDVPNTRSSTYAVSAKGQPRQDMSALVFTDYDRRETVDFRLGVADGDWLLLSSCSADRKDKFEHILEDGSEVVWTAPSEIDGIALIEGRMETRNGQMRVVGLDYRGQIIHTGSSENKFNNDTYYFRCRLDAPLTQVQEFQLQYRPYEWVTFKNVSLRPGAKTQVETASKISTAQSSGQSTERTTENSSGDFISLPGGFGGLPVSRSQIRIEAKVFTAKITQKMAADYLNEDLKVEAALDAQGLLCAAVLTDEQSSEFQKWMGSMAGASLLACPKVKVFDGETSQLIVADTKKFTTGYVNDTPKVEDITTGVQFEFTPQLLKDENAVRLSFSFEKTAILDVIKQTTEDGREIELPGIETKSAATTITIPQGKTIFVPVAGIGGMATPAPEPSKTEQIFLLIKTEVENQSSLSNLRTLEEKIDISPADFELCFDSKRQMYYLVVSIQNQGRITIPKHKIRFYRGNRGVFDEGLDETGNQPSGWHEAGPVEPGQTWNERTRNFGLPDGNYTFTVVLDYDNAVPETNETNNRAALDIIIKDGRIENKTGGVLQN